MYQLLFKGTVVLECIGTEEIAQDVSNTYVRVMKKLDRDNHRVRRIDKRHFQLKHRKGLFVTRDIPNVYIVRSDKAVDVVQLRAPALEQAQIVSRCMIRNIKELKRKNGRLFSKGDYRLIKIA